MSAAGLDAVDGAEGEATQQPADVDGRRGSCAIVAAFAVASGPPEGRKEEPVRAEDEVDDITGRRREHRPSRLQIKSNKVKIA